MENLLLEKGLAREAAQKLSQKENKILDKAKEIEREMEALKNEKISLLVNLYKEQLFSEAESQRVQFIEENNIQHEKQMVELGVYKDKKMQKMNNLSKKIEEQILAYKQVLKDLSEKKEELELSHLAAKEYLVMNKSKNLEEFNTELAKSLDKKVEEFKDQVKDSNFDE